MRGMLVGLMIIVASIAAPAAAAPELQFVHPGSKCATGWEMNQIEDGMPRKVAEEILDGPGRAFPHWKNQHAYRPCSRSWHRSQYRITYRDGRVWIGFMVVMKDGSRLEKPPIVL